MSRDEARRCLHGTFNFEMDGGQVVVRDESLLEEIHELIASTPEYARSASFAIRDSNTKASSYSALA